MLEHYLTVFWSKKINNFIIFWKQKEIENTNKLKLSYVNTINKRDDKTQIWKTIRIFEPENKIETYIFVLTFTFMNKEN